MKLRGTEGDLFRALRAQYPEAKLPTGMQYQLRPYQMLALFGLATAYVARGSRILEIGTGHGASGVMLAQAASGAQILSLTTSAKEAKLAAENWQAARLPNISAATWASWDYLVSPARARDPLDMVFVDGDHNRIVLDMPWFNELKVGGLFVCHDYSPVGARGASPIVYEVLNRFRDQLGRDLDVEIIDELQTGMAGFYRREGERWR